MKKLLLALSLLFITGCTKEEQLPEYVDQQFLESLSEGLQNRFDYADSDESTVSNEVTQTEILVNAINCELDALEGYNNGLFEDSKLQEYAIAYINELNYGIEVANTYGSEQMFLDWDQHSKDRKGLLAMIEENYDIPIDEEYSLIFNELFNEGKEALIEEQIQEDIESLVDTIVFSELPQEYQSEYFYYEAIVENITKYDFESIYFDITVIDEDGVNIGTNYVYATNWDSGTKVRLEFMSEKISTMEVELSYYTLSK